MINGTTSTGGTEHFYLPGVEEVGLAEALGKSMAALASTITRIPVLWADPEGAGLIKSAVAEREKRELLSLGPRVDAGSQTIPQPRRWQLS